MNAVAVKRWLDGLTLFMAKLVTLTLLPWSSRSEGENQNEYRRSWSLDPEANSSSPQWQAVPLMRSFNVFVHPLYSPFEYMHFQKYYLGLYSLYNGILTSSFVLISVHSHSRDSFYPGRPVSHAVLFFNVNIFNLSRGSFSSDLIFAPLLPILLNYIQIRSSRTSMASVICTLAYYLALAAKFSFPGFSSQFEALMTVFGSLALATLTCLALQLPWWSIFFIVLFIGGFFKLLNKLHAAYGNIRRPPQTRMMHPLLPF